MDSFITFFGACGHKKAASFRDGPDPKAAILLKLLSNGHDRRHLSDRRTHGGDRVIPSDGLR